MINFQGSSQVEVINSRPSVAFLIHSKTQTIAHTQSLLVAPQLLTCPEQLSPTLSGTRSRIGFPTLFAMKLERLATLLLLAVRCRNTTVSHGQSVSQIRICTPEIVVGDPKSVT